MNYLKHRVTRDFVLLLILFSLSRCGDKEKDNKEAEGKKNGEWVFWEDENTGKKEWIKMGNRTTVKNGRYTLYYFNGTVYEKGRLKNGENIDTIFSYNADGIICKYSIILPDTTIHYFLNDGTYNLSFANGNKFVEGIVSNHSPGDKWLEYYPNGKMKFRRELINGKGWMADYYENGQIKDSGIKVGNEQIPLKSWYYSGQLKSEQDLTDGKLTGFAKRYYENGKIKTKLYFVDGVLEGEGIQWYENGNINSIFNFKNDKQEGLQRVYFENGKLKVRSYAKNGEFDGEVVSYDTLGNTLKVDHYINGIRKTQ